jgi:hypothetical protein
LHNSGLGKGLSGILGEALSTDRAPEVSELLGISNVRRDPEVRRLVSGLALDSLADGFGADAVVLVSRDEDNELASVSSRLPASWESLEAVPFETIGRLWSALDDDDMLDEQQTTLGEGVSLLLCRSNVQRHVTATAVLRSRPFDDNEIQTISRLVRSVAHAIHGDAALPSETSIRVLTRESEDGLLADVRLGDEHGRRNAAAVGDDAVSAVAHAAAELCDAALTVSFAGQTTVLKSLVTIVILLDDSGGPLLGLAVTDTAAATGPVEAVFRAARVVNLDPFASSAAAHR